MIFSNFVNRKHYDGDHDFGTQASEHFFPFHFSHILTHILYFFIYRQWSRQPLDRAASSRPITPRRVSFQISDSFQQSATEGVDDNGAQNTGVVGGCPVTSAAGSNRPRTGLRKCHSDRKTYPAFKNIIPGFLHTYLTKIFCFLQKIFSKDCYQASSKKLLFQST